MYAEINSATMKTTTTILSLFFIVFFVYPSVGHSWDTYDGANCTVMIGKKKVKIDASLEDQGRCDYGQGKTRFVGVRMNGKYNLYDQKMKRFVLKKWGSYVTWSFMENADDVNSIVIERDDTHQILNLKTGKILLTLKDQAIQGPIGDKELYVINDNDHWVGSPCRVIKPTGDNRYIELAKTPFSHCGINSHKTNSNIFVLYNEKTGDRIEYDAANMLKSPNDLGSFYTSKKSVNGWKTRWVGDWREGSRQYSIICGNGSDGFVSEFSNNSYQPFWSKATGFKTLDEAARNSCGTE